VVCARAVPPLSLGGALGSGGDGSLRRRDRYGGATGKLVPSADHLAHPLRVEGPLGGEDGRLPELLLVAFFLWRRPEGDVVRYFEEHDPELVMRARGLEPPRAFRPTGT
jgi:hypothetical protein